MMKTIGSKIGGGFIVVLILLIAVACISVKTMMDIKEITAENESLERVLLEVYKIRRQEIRFINTGDTAYADKVNEKLKHLKDLEAWPELAKVFRDYGNAFEAYVKLHKTRRDAIEAMEAAAAATHKQIEHLRNEQKNRLAEMHARVEQDVEMKTGVMEDVHSLIQLMGKGQILQMTLMRKKTGYVMKQWQAHNHAFAGLLTDLGGRFPSETESCQITEDLLAAHREYVKVFYEYLEDPVSSKRRFIMTFNSRGKQMLAGLYEIQAGLLSESRSKRKTEIDIFLKKTQDAESVTRKFLVARKTESKYIKGDRAAYDAAYEMVKETIGISGGLADSAGDKTVTSLETYLAEMEKCRDAVAKQEAQRLAMAEASEKAEENCEKAMSVKMADMADKIALTRGFVISGSAAAIVFGAFFAVLITLSVNKQIKLVTGKLKESAAQVSATAGNVSSLSKSLAAGASEQTASIEESSSSLAKMSAMSAKTAEMTRDSEELMKKSIHESGQSLKAFVELTGKMAQIEANSDRIGNVIKSIDEIAFQTNLLALNAAVEAARAGEAGAGFAVVADEVRNLALRAKDAAKNTQELLDSTIIEIRESTGAIKNENDNFKRIIDSATRLGDITGSITSASNEVSKGIEHLNIAVADMEKIVHDNASTSEETSWAADEMNSQAGEMMGFVRELATMIEGIGNRGKESGTGNFESIPEKSFRNLLGM